MKYFSSILAFVLVLSLFAPIGVAANTQQAKPFKPNNQNESIMQQKAAIDEQLNVLQSEPTLHKGLKDLSANEEVAVIVHLSEKPVALEKAMKELAGKSLSSSQEAAVKTKVQAQQAQLKKDMKLKNINFKEGFSYHTVLNGFSATVKAGDLQKLLSIKGVTLIEPDTEVHALEDAPTKVSSGTVDANMNTSISFLGIEQLWNEGIEGQGIKVAVLDTGIDKDHPEFAGIYKGGKNFIPNSSTYARARATDDASETSPVERPAGTPEFNANGSAFYTSHGTHVAGTIAAIGANQYGIKGIAPKVDLYAYRVLGAYGSGATSGIVAAIEESVLQEMDVINLSLGGGGNTETDAGSFAINNAMLAGTIAVIATGNSGPNRGTMGTPSTARLGIAVGNTTNPETMFNGRVDVTIGEYTYSKKLNLMGSTFGSDLSTQLSGEYEVVAVPGVGKPTDFNGLDVKGKVALISRGEIAFVDKIAAAKAEGAVATLIHNSAAGSNAPNASGIFLGDAFEFLPTFDMSYTDGVALRAELANGNGTVTFGEFNSTKTLGDEVNSSSSRGPSTPNFDIKPDVTAPGTNIMSTIPMYKADFPEVTYEQAYTRKTGTSMATPHIAGIAALVKQANPDWDAFDVKVALSNTAKILDTNKYDVFAQGAGRVNAYAAAHPEILAYAIDEAVQNGTGTIAPNIKGTVTFGPQSLKEGDISVTKEVLVKDLAGNGGDFTVSVEVTKSFEGADVTVDQTSFTLDDEQMLNVNLTASQSMTAKPGDEILGYIHISNDETTVSLPFAADFGGAAATEIKNYSITKTDLSFNGDGIQDSAVLAFTLTGDVAPIYIEIWDVMDPEGGEYGDGYIGYLHAGAALGAGSYTLNVSGQYTPWGGGARTTIPDGLYTIDINAGSASGTLGAYVGPVVVKTTKPGVNGSVAEGVATGQVTDKYLDYNDELLKYGLNFDLNEKLFASYITTTNGETAEAVDFDLAQDGSFTFPVSAETDSVTVVISDAAGNVGEALIYEKEVAEQVVTLSVTPTELNLTKGAKAQLKVTETTTPEEGEPTEKDVTKDATYVVEKDSIVSVTEGLVTAKSQGSSKVTISYGGKDVVVNVTVKNPPSSGGGGSPTPPTDPNKVIVDHGNVTNQANDSKTLEIVVEVPALTDEKPEVSIQVPAPSLKVMADSSKSLVLQSGTAQMIVPNKVLKDLGATSPESTTITVKMHSSTDIDGAVSATYEFTIVSLKDGVPTTTSTFSEPVELTIPTNKLVNDSRKVAAYHLNEAPKSFNYVGGTYEDGTFSFRTNHFSKFVVIESAKTFNDIQNFWAQDEIEVLASRSITTGYSDTAFNPGGNVTRAEFAVLIARALNLPLKEYEGTFTDVTKNKAWAYAGIEAAYRAGIVNGKSETSFDPDALITREEIATMIVRAVKYQDASLLKDLDTSKSFADEHAIGTFAKVSVKQAVGLGIVKGLGGNKFGPKANASRAEAAVMLYRALDKLNAF